MKTLAQLRKGVYPRPVYEAHFADNTYVRLSFWSPKGKPLDADRARQMIETMTEWTAGIERVAHYRGLDGDIMSQTCAPFTPVQSGLLTGKRLVRGYVEHDVPNQPWQRFVDPHFMPKPVETEKPKRITAKVAKEALADLLDWLDGDGPDDALDRARELIAA